MNKAIISGVVVALVIGLAFGSFVFPRTTTLTTTQVTTTTQIITYQLTLSSKESATTAGEYPVVTLTAVVVNVYYFTAECTTVSGTKIVTYINGPGGQLTTVVTVYNGTLPQKYFAAVTTNYASLSASFTTQPFTGSC